MVHLLLPILLGSPMLDEWTRTTSSSNYDYIIHQEKQLILHDSDWSLTFSCKNHGSWLCTGSSSTEVSWTLSLGSYLLGSTNITFAGGPEEIIKDNHKWAQHRQYMRETTDVETFTKESESLSRSRTTALRVFYRDRVVADGSEGSSWFGAPW